jgi:hypothetical protein
MKTSLSTLFLIIGLSAAADSGGHGIYNFKDADIGEVQVRVTDIGETIDVMSVTVLCYDKRTKANAVKPAPEHPPELADVPICLYRPRENAYDPRTKILTIHYSLSAFRPGQATCNTHVKTLFDLRKWCAPWQPN